MNRSDTDDRERDCGLLNQHIAERLVNLEKVIAGLEGFNRTVCHDLRGPIGGIAQLAQLAELQVRGGHTQQALTYLALISDQADQSLRLLTALLDLARADLVPLRNEPVSLQSLAEMAVRDLQVTHGPIAVTINLMKLPLVPGDSTLLGAVFSNLIGNARKYSSANPEAAVRVEGSVDTNLVTVQVEDNGVGFEPSAASQLFQPFERLHDALFAGHGIGLTIVRRVVERHGGRVWAEGLPGRGATFSFTLRR